MEHVAILRKSWGLIGKILSGEKKIESRWYMARCAPWGRIKAGETVYFKDSGEPVTIKTTVENVLQFSELTPEKVREIVDRYGGVNAICVNDASETMERNKNKRYCMLIFLKNPQTVEPFNIDKRGFGIMTAWISVKKVDGLRTFNSTRQND